MPGQCPGQDSRNLSVSLHLCPKCGKEVEMFSDEMRVKCPQCKSSVEKETYHPVSSGVNRPNNVWALIGGKR